MSAELLHALDATSADLLGYLERRVAVREDAADLLAETALHAWRRVRDLPEGAERQRGHVSAAAPGAPDAAEAHAVRDAVRRLPADQRDLVVLVHWDGFTLAAAAELLGVNASTARGRYASARAALRRALDDSGPPTAVDHVVGVPAGPARG